MSVTGVMPCSGCGERGPEIRSKKEPKLCFYVRCPRCGREGPKHREIEGAILEWRRMEEYDEPEK